MKLMFKFKTNNKVDIKPLLVRFVLVYLEKFQHGQIFSQPQYFIHYHIYFFGKFHLINGN